MTIAAVQLDGHPAPRSIRLDRAQRLVEHAAAAGARLVVLPEQFEIGYSYDDSNHARYAAFIHHERPARDCRRSGWSACEICGGGVTASAMPTALWKIWLPPPIVLPALFT